MSQVRADSADPRPGRGRPRDPSVIPRAHSAALQLYAEGGLSAVTFESVAGLTSIGKPALYRRWSSAEELLLSAIAAATHAEGIVDTGSLEGDLFSLMQAIRGQLSGDAGLVAIRLLLDALARPDLVGPVADGSLTIALREARRVVPRAIARGELPPGTPSSLLIEDLVGGVLMRVLTGRLGADPVSDVSDDYLRASIELVLDGARARP